MSNRGWSTSNFRRISSALVTATPLSIVAWGQTSITGVQQFIAGIFSSGSTNNRFSLAIASTNAIIASAADASASSSATTTTMITANVAFFACGVWASSTDRSAYLNGGGKGTSAVSRVPASMDRTSIGTGDTSINSNPFAPAGTGDIGVVGLYKTALSDGDAARLASGIDPTAVQREFLVGLWRLDGGGGNEFNVVDPSKPMVLQGALSLSAPPPKFFIPKSPVFLAH